MSAGGIVPRILILDTPEVSGGLHSTEERGVEGDMTGRGEVEKVNSGGEG
jgi:hypothetical protein